MSAFEAMTFERYGRSYHLKIDRAEDLDAVLRLNEAHWVATSAPIETIHCDPAFLTLVDTDRNNRIMCVEVIDAIRWLNDVLADRSGVTARSRSLRPAALNTDHEDGRRIRDSVKKMLRQLGTPKAEEITLEQVREIRRTAEATPVSEAGVVLPEAADDAEVRRFLVDVLATVGGVPHPGGGEGVNREKLEVFLKGVEVHLDWLSRAEIPGGETKTDVMPLGTDTPAAFAVFAAVRDKVDQFFAQCQAVALDDRLARHIGPTDAELEAMDLNDAAVIEQVLKDAPIARPDAGRTLSFEGKTNPCYAEPVARLRSVVVEPVLGRSVDRLTEVDWFNVKAKFATHEAGLADKPSGGLEALGADRLHVCLDPRLRTAVETLIAESTKTAFVLDNVRLTEKLVLYQAYMIPLVNNFVSFPDLYDETERAMFEMGTLICDGRRFNMSVKVQNRGEHSAIARNSSMYVLYAEITSRDGQRKLEVALPVTSGGKGNLCVGKRGLFIDVDGGQWDARIVQIIENPISLGEALASPFRRIGRAITGKIESLTTEGERKLDASAAAAVTQAPPTPAASPAPGRGGTGMMTGGMIMGGGVALAALGSALAYITKTLSEANGWAILGGIGGAVLAVMLPISILAVIKLRRRDLSAILEGAGWAINARMRLSRRQSRFFTQRPRYPKEARGIRYGWWWLVLVLLAIVLGSVLGIIFTRGGEKTTPPAADRPPAQQPADTR